jgi:hypothetical protein
VTFKVDDADIVTGRTSTRQKSAEDARRCDRTSIIGVSSPVALSAILDRRSWMRKSVERDRAELSRQREMRALAQERLDDFEAWCHNVAAYVEDLTYDQKRTALDELGVKVQVWRGDRDPRWKINAKMPFLIRSNSQSTIRIAHSIA